MEEEKTSFEVVLLSFEVVFLSLKVEMLEYQVVINKKSDPYEAAPTL